MKILAVSDEECAALWEHYTPGKLKDYDLILSCGDLKSNYLSFLVTMARCPLLYVHGNHDEHYDRQPPEGCDCIDDKLVTYNGLRILGLGGCLQYHPGKHQYTEKQMQRRIQKLRGLIKRAGGVDLVLTHAPARGLGDAEDAAHMGFEALRTFLDEYRPAWLVHGHVHLRYCHNQPRILTYEDTTIVNASERYVLDIPEKEYPAELKNVLLYKGKDMHRD